MIYKQNNPPTGRGKLNLEESQNKSAYQKRNFAELVPNIGFSEFDFYNLYRSTFEKSELGRIDVPEDVHGAELSGTEDAAVAGHPGRTVKAMHAEPGYDVHGCYLL